MQRSTRSCDSAAVKPEDWKARWVAGQTGFHEGAPNSYLVAHAAKLRGRVFVPLCGKTRDMSYLASLGHRVVGVEVSELAATQFFEESGVTPEREKRGPFEIFSAGGVEIFVGDVF